MITPCRLFVIPARDAPIAIILRRGPSKWYHIIRWFTDSDHFEQGAWFHGRIYEERCDISPDGNLFVYFCHGGAYRPGYTDSWTAVSRVPWLYALSLWPWGQTMGGGGRFVGNRRLILHSKVPCSTHPDHPATGLDIALSQTECAEYHQSTCEVEEADWSGHDHRGNLIICRVGKLFRRCPSGQDLEIADFNTLRPSPEEAPDWAKEPLTVLP